MSPVAHMMSVLSLVLIWVTYSSFPCLLEFHKSPTLLCTSVWGNRNKIEWTTASLAFEFPHSIALWRDMKAGVTMSFSSKGTIFLMPRNLCLESSWVGWWLLKVTRISLTLTSENVLLMELGLQSGRLGFTVRWTKQMHFRD